MPVQGDFDIKIGAYSFKLDLSKDEPYAHYFVDAATGKSQIAGEVGGESAQDDLIQWSYTDWVRGEGNRRWYPDDPAVYEYAGALNPRIPGQLTGRPTRGSVSVTVTDGKQRPYFAIGAGRLWIACDQTLRYSTDQGATWTDATSTLNLAANWKVTAMAGDHSGVYIAARNSTNRILRKVDFSGGGGALAGADVVASVAAANPWVGLAFMGGKLYGWTGRKLFEFDVFDTLPLTLDAASSGYRKVHDTGADVAYADFGGSAAGSWWADIANTENSVIYFVGMEGSTRVFEYRNNRGAPLWDPMPFGMTTKSMKVQQGKVYFAGHWSGESSPTGGFGCIYAVSLDSLTPLFLGWFRKSQALNLQMQEMANSYGEQIMLGAAKNGKVFIYDADEDAITLLDDLALTSTFKIGDMITVGQKRLVAVYEPQAGGATTTVTVYRYSSDEPGDRESVGSLSETLNEGFYDAGFPHELKLLFGFMVTFEPLAANQRIKIEYQVDGSGSWVAAGAVITSATSGASDGRVYLDVSSTGEKFYRINVRFTLDNNATSGVTLPILFGVTPAVKVARKLEYWDLYLRFKDEHQKRGSSRSRALLAEQIRDFLLVSADLNTALTLEDGARYASRPNKTSTHKIVIEQVKDSIQRPGSLPDRSAEGACFVRLRAVPA